MIGGAINFSTNHTDSKGGGIAWATYLIFVGFGTVGFSNFISPMLMIARMLWIHLGSFVVNDVKSAPQGQQPSQHECRGLVEGRISGTMVLPEGTQGR